MENDEANLDGYKSDLYDEEICNSKFVFIDLYCT